jgi:hypothetical protein
MQRDGRTDMTKLRVVIRKFANMHENNGDDKDHQSLYLLCAAALRGEKITLPIIKLLTITMN